MSPARPPAGWFTDPYDATRQRWWDGHAWTGFLFDPSFGTDAATAADTETPAATESEAARDTSMAASATQAAADGPEPAVAAAAAPRPGTVAPQRVLLALGAVLLIAAAAAFIAFAWTVVGPSGRAGLITLVAAAFLIAAVLVRLTAIRETFAVIGMGTVAVELMYGTAAGLIPRDVFATSGPWLTLTFGVATLAAAALGVWARLVSARIVSGVTYVIGVLTGLGYAHHALVPETNAPAFFAAGLAIVCALTWAIPRLAVWPSVRLLAALALAGAGWLIVCFAMLILFAENDLSSAWVVALAVIAGAAGGLWRAAPADHALRPTLVLVATAFASGAIGLAIGLGLVSIPITSATAASVLGSAAVLAGIQFRRPWHGVTSALALWVTWAVSAGLAEARPDDESWAIGAFLASAAVLALAFAVLGREPRVIWAAGPLGVLAAWVMLDSVGVTAVEPYSLAFAVGVVVTLVVAERRDLLARALAVDLALIGLLVSALPSAAVAITALADDRIMPGEWLSIVVTALGIAGAFAVALLRHRLRWAAIGAAAVLLVEVWTLGGDWLAGSPTVEYLAWTTWGCFALAVLVVVPRAHWREFLGWGALGAAGTSTLPATWWAWDVDTSEIAAIPWLSITLTAAAVAALVVVGFVRRNVWLFWLAAVLSWCVASGLFVIRIWPDDYRAGLVVTGAVLLIAGGCTRVVIPATHSMLWLGIPLLFIVIPFAITPGCDPAASPAGFTVVLLATGAMAIVGGWRRIAGLLVPGAVGVGIIAANVLWDAALAVPAWVSLGLAGAVLLVVGVRLEATRAGARKGTAWVKSLD